MADRRSVPRRVTLPYIGSTSPKFALLENASGCNKVAGRRALNAILRRLRAANYVIYEGALDSIDDDVPQSRPREYTIVIHTSLKHAIDSKWPARHAPVFLSGFVDLVSFEEEPHRTRVARRNLIFISGKLWSLPSNVVCIGDPMASPRRMQCQTDRSPCCTKVRLEQNGFGVFIGHEFKWEQLTTSEYANLQGWPSDVISVIAVKFANDKLHRRCFGNGIIFIVIEAILKQLLQIIAPS